MNYELRIKGKNIVAAALCAASFFILYSFFLPTPARAVISCPDGGVVSDPNLPEIWQCCNYENSPKHIPQPDSQGRCDSTHCQMQNFPKNEDSNTYGGACRYCNTNVTVRIDGCSGCGCTCNQACAPAPPNGDDDGEDENCHMPDENLTTCCPVEDVAGSAPAGFWDHIHNLLEIVGDALWNTKLPFISLKVEDFKVSEKFDKAIDYYYGKAVKNEEGEDEIDPGVFFKLAPPSLLEEELPTEEAKVAKRNENAKWIVGTSRESGGSGADALNDGKLKNEAYPWAATMLRDFLVAIPKPEDSTFSQRRPETTLATNPSGNPNPQNLGEVLAATDLCAPPVVEADTKKTCTPPDAEGKDATVRDLYNIFSGEGLFPKLADLDKIGRFTAGDETEDGASEEDAFDDPHYEDGGFLEIFKLPNEDYIEHNAKGVGNLKLNFTLPIVNIGFEVNLGQKNLKLRHQGSDTEAREKENGVYAKLTVPQAGNGTALLRQDYGGPAASGQSSIVLASANTPLSPLTPLNLSFAERLGRTLGGWLAKIITL